VYFVARETLLATSLRQEFDEFRVNVVRQFPLVCFSLEPQVVTGAFHGQQLCFSWNHLDRALNFFNRSEWIACALDKQRRCAQVGEMLRALLFGTARGMQRVGQQEQARDQVWLLGAEHTGLAAAVRVPAEEKSSFFVLVRAKISTSPNVREKWGTQGCFQRCDGVLQTGTVAGGVAGAGWAQGSRLAIRQITAKHGEAFIGECIRQGAEQRGLGVATGAVGQNEAVAIGCFGDVQESHGVGFNGVVSEFADGVGQGMILNPGGRRAW